MNRMIKVVGLGERAWGCMRQHSWLALFKEGTLCFCVDDSET